MRAKAITVQILFILALWLLIPLSASAATIYVGQGEAYETIQTGVDAALSGDTIIVRNGIYKENVKITTSNITIISEDTGGETIVVAAKPNDHVFTIEGDRVTIDGLVIYGATHEKAGVYIGYDCDYITIINNYCGYDSQRTNYVGIRVGGGDQERPTRNNTHLQVIGNRCLSNFTHGILLETTTYSTISENNCAQNGEACIYFRESSHNTITNNQCSSNRTGIELAGNVRSNTVSQNTCNSNLDGIALWGGLFNLISKNTANSNNSAGIVVGRSYYFENRINENVCENNSTGIYLKMVSGLAVYDNGISSNNIGISVTYASYNTIMGNAVTANGVGVSFYLSEYNTVILNDFTNSTGSHVSSVEAANNWHLPVEVYYDYTGGSIHQSRMGNHYDDQKGNDNDNDGIGSKRHETDGEGDLYPLWKTSDRYSIQAWWLGKDREMYQDVVITRPYYPSITLKGGEAKIWTADRPEGSEVAFTEEEQWIGRLYFHSAPLGEGHTFTMEAGYTDGTNFSAGPTATLTGDGSRVDFQYRMDSTAFSIPAGHYLAVRASNDNEGVDYDLRVEGTWAYLSHGTPEKKKDRVSYDFNGDGRTDILWRHTGAGGTGGWLMDGVRFDRHVFFGSREVPGFRIVGVGDINGDGKSDLLWRRQDPGAVEVWIAKNLNGFNDMWTSLSLLNMEGDHRLAGPADFNGDGREDLLWRNQATGENTIWLMGEGGISETVLMARVGGDWGVAGLGDMDGDGQTDVLWRNWTTGAVAAWRLEGTTLKSYRSLGGVRDLNWQIAGLGDASGDGRADILWRHQTHGGCALWLMEADDGPGPWRYLSLETVADLNWHITGFRDFNGDRRADVLWRHRTTGHNALWVMGEEGRFDYRSLDRVRDPDWEMR